MRTILALLAILLLCVRAACAAPFAYTDPAAVATQPDSAYYTVNGGAQIACALEPFSGSVRMKCDLAQIAAAGDYTLVLTWCKAGAIVNDPGGGGATNTAAGCASAVPFVYRLRVGATGSLTGTRVAP